MKEVLFSNRLLKISKKNNALKSKLILYSFFRLISFLLFLSSLIIPYLQKSSEIGYIPSLFFFGIFFWCIKTHSKIRKFQDDLENYSAWLKQESGRLARDFSKLPNEKIPEGIRAEDFPIFSDLDFAGNTGIWKWIDVSGTISGKKKLWSFLFQSESFSKDEILSRQVFLQNFSNLKYKNLSILSKLSLFPQSLDLKSIRETLRCETQFWWISFLRFLPILTWASVTLGIFGIYSVFTFFLLLQVAISSVYVSKNYETRKREWELETHLEKICKLLQVLKNNSHSRKNFKTLLSIFENKKLCESPGGMFFWNSFFLLEVRMFHGFQKWYKTFGASFHELLSELEEIDSVLSLSYLKILHPETSFPILSKNDISLSAQEIFHPLIPPEQLVKNPLETVQTKKPILITGSNMSGKTTFIRSIGVNSILGMAGGPVFGKEFHLPFVEIFSSIRNSDNLLESTSYFYAEVKTIARIWKHCQKSSGDRTNLLLLDEILKGTNSYERNLATRKLIETWKEKDLFLFITTHDLELTKLKGIVLKYFQDDVVGTSMHFDYKIRTGVLVSTNALKVLEKEGVVFSESINDLV